MSKPNIGLIGLGTMGGNLALNIADNGFPIAVYNRTLKTTHAFHSSAGKLADSIFPCDTLEGFVNAIEAPRSIILMVPAGPVVDAQIKALRPLLDKGDLIIDAGNANYHDTNRRALDAENNVENFLGIGVSGGEEGARFGPSIMGGGPKESWDIVAPVLEAISAKYNETPCATWMGEGGAGHFVKMVHNGIEYADMQMIAEAYGIMRDGLGMKAPEISDVFAKWNEGPLKSYLIEISAEVSKVIDEKAGVPILDVILDRAGQKGTGRWTAIEALHLGSPITAIDAAVAARNLSSRLDERAVGQDIFGPAPQAVDPDHMKIDMLEKALLAGKVACYAQGFDMLAAASTEYKWNLPMPDTAKVWREGCIIRSTMLNDMAEALTANPDVNLMFSPFFAKIMKDTNFGLRKVVGYAATAGHPVPALAAGLAYFDMMRTKRSTANMIQAQRDFFGAHSFERLGEEGAHHGPWAGTGSSTDT
ncbi:MAG: NADP-dependent phosphogluconate dehydrogenase [Rhizobiales bacterium]|nr:NADP-dependent phosphogluconate dehydrogenase [Hyphomicrobiales bacterium]